MSILDRIIGKIAPHDCLGCGTEGSLLCGACETSLPALPERCYRCHQASPDALTCLACQSFSDLRQVSVCAVYGGTVKNLIWKLKSRGARAAAGFMAAGMLRHLPDSPEILIVPVPTAAVRARQRGYDQAKLLARDLSRRARRPYANCLARSGQAHQVGAGREQRLRQLSGALRVNRPLLVRGAHIVLIDDVITTGATLEAAAKVLRSAGAVRVDALAYAQPLFKADGKSQ